MKRRIAIRIALVLSIVSVSLLTSVSTAEAQGNRLYSVDTGEVTLGSGQTLRVSVVSPRDPASGQATGVRFRQIEYSQNVCNMGICRHAILSQNLTPLMMLETTESITVDLDWAANVAGSRIIVLTNNPNVQVNALIIEIATGKVLSLNNKNPDLIRYEN